MSRPAVTNGECDLLPGFHGKVPSHGDFVGRRVPKSFLEPWERWLQQAMTKSKEQLGEAWLEIYLTSPIWRIAMSSGICGERVACGVLMPSVDQVGRHYPLILMIFLPAAINPMTLPVSSEEWFSKAEKAALYCLEDDFDFEEFDSRVKELSSPLQAELRKSSLPQPIVDHGSDKNIGWRLRLNSTDQLHLDPYPKLLDCLSQTAYSKYSIWWTKGSDLVPPSLFVCEALPPIEIFSALLDGDWKERKDPGQKEANSFVWSDGQVKRELQ